MNFQHDPTCHEIFRQQFASDCSKGFRKKRVQENIKYIARHENMLLLCLQIKIWQ